MVQIVRNSQGNGNGRENRGNCKIIIIEEVIRELRLFTKKRIIPRSVDFVSCFSRVWIFLIKKLIKDKCIGKCKLFWLCNIKMTTHGNYESERL